MKTREKIELILVIVICASVFTYNFHKGYIYGKEEALKNLQQNSDVETYRVVGGYY